MSLVNNALLAAQADIAGIVPKNLVEPVKDHGMCQAQIIGLTVTIGSFFSGKVAQGDLHATLNEIGINFMRLMFELLTLAFAHEEQRWAIDA